LFPSQIRGIGRPQIERRVEPSPSRIEHDLTELNRSQEALRASNEALRRANADLEHFSHAAEHELQEPLRMVTVFSQMLKEKYGGQLDSQADEFIRYSVEGASRMQALVRDLVVYTHTANISDRRPTLVALSALVCLAVENLTEAVAENHASIEFGVLPRLCTHAGPLQEVFERLISNAIKYRGGAPPVVAVSAVPRQHDWLISVEDNGIGIEPEDTQQIFGLFKRLHSTSEYPGTGLGLAICKRIVERLKGAIWVESVPGKGSTFFFTLPRAS
jgi:light-regulated signal transduction histidine kinase (bacteriophytochrome)